jgi:hypothetical protein
MVRRTATRVTREMERLCHAMKSNDPGDGVWPYYVLKRVRDVEDVGGGGDCNMLWCWCHKRATLTPSSEQFYM